LSNIERFASVYDARNRSSISRYCGAQAFTNWSAVFRSSAAPSMSAGIAEIVNVFDRTRTMVCGALGGGVEGGTGVRTGVGAADGALLRAMDCVAAAVSDALPTAVLLGSAVCGAPLHAVVVIASVSTKKRARMPATYKSETPKNKRVAGCLGRRAFIQPNRGPVPRYRCVLPSPLVVRGAKVGLGQKRVVRLFVANLRRSLQDDGGLATIEYVIGAAVVLGTLVAGVSAWNNGLVARLQSLAAQLAGVR
jgi:hypothetical protein